jgi:L-arabinokinase
MYHIVEGTTHGLSDVEAFLKTLNTLEQCRFPGARALFDKGAELFVTRAPGRLDVMGGIADYSGALVLEMPLREATFVALQRDDTRRLKIVSLAEDASREMSVELSLDDFESDGCLATYEAARLRFQQDATQHWAAYVAGVFLMLMREGNACFSNGARLLIASQVPEGKGVSSSAALEVAVMQAVVAAFDIAIEPREMAILCQKAENLVVGAACGVMDQMTVACGQEERLLALLCQPAELQESVAIPEEIAFWGVDSGVRHAVSGADYHSVRVGAFMGYRIIAELAGLKVEETSTPGLVRITDPHWLGFLANVTPSRFEQCYGDHLPERISGAEFLSRYKGTTDAVTRVAAERTYAVRRPTAHPIYEHHRVRLFAELLKAEASPQGLELLGELMYQSHASYSACGLGSANTDRLVALVREAGAAQGLFGAKITGGGSGGTVAILGSRETNPAVERLAKIYAQETGHQARIFSGSSPGSAAFGYVRLQASESPGTA